MLNELMARVRAEGARLVVEGNRLGIDGDVTEELAAGVREHRDELKAYLRWDREVARDLIRRAWRFVAERHVAGAGYAPGIVEGPEGDMDNAFVHEDMWAYRTAVREWVEAWMAAIAEAKGKAA